VISKTHLSISAIAVVVMLSPIAQRAANAADGDLDATFGTGGKVKTDFATSFDNGSAVAIQGDGKIVMAGANFDGVGGADFAVARYNSNGSLDASFGTGGKVTTDFASSYDQATAIAIQRDGKIVVAGRTMTGGSNDDFGLVRYNADGSLDASFGAGGKVHTDFGATFFERANAVAIQSDGKIIAAGETNSGAAGTDFALARYNSDGTLDTSFGSGGTGLVVADFANAYDQAFALAIQSDGRIVAVGNTAPVGLGSDFALARYNGDGTLDTTFGSGGTGLVTTDLGGGASDLAHAVAIQSDGKIVVAGETSSSGSGTGTDFAVARYNVDGSLDVSFGSGGAVATDFATSTDQAYGVAIQADGKIIASGFVFVQNVAGNGDFGLARYNTNGTLDTSFGSGGNGLVTTDFSVSFDSAMGMAIQADGKILVVGSTFSGGAIGAADFALARYEGPPPAPPHTVTFYLHTHDAAGTAGGFTMNQTAAAPHFVWLNVDGDPSWFSEPAVNGTFVAGATFRLVLPCTFGVILPNTVTLAATNLAGDDIQPLGQASQGLTICFGRDTVTTTIPVTAPVTLTNQRLKLTIAWMSHVKIPLLLGSNAFLQATNLAGTP
jgi:uncharacterized delta-60 repeat protein